MRDEKYNILRKVRSKERVVRDGSWLDNLKTRLNCTTADVFRAPTSKSESPWWLPTFERRWHVKKKKNKPVGKLENKLRKEVLCLLKSGINDVICYKLVKKLHIICWQVTWQFRFYAICLTDGTLVNRMYYYTVCNSTGILGQHHLWSVSLTLTIWLSGKFEIHLFRTS